MLRQAEAHLEAKDKDIKKYQETIEALQIGKQDAEEQTNTYLKAVIANRDEYKKLEDDFFNATAKIEQLEKELAEAKKPFLKKLFKC